MRRVVEENAQWASAQWPWMGELVLGMRRVVGLGMVVAVVQIGAVTLLLAAAMLGVQQWKHYQSLDLTLLAEVRPPPPAATATAVATQQRRRRSGTGTAQRGTLRGVRVGP